MLSLKEKIKLNIFNSQQIWLDYEDKTKMSDLLNFLDYKHFGLSGAKDLEMLK